MPSKRLSRITTGLLSLVLTLSGPLLGAALSEPGDDTVMKAMRDELARSMAKLQLNSLSKPYFISYLVTETTSTDASATFGSLLGSGQHRTRRLTVVVRVGDYALDNTNFLALRMPFGRMGMVRMSGGSVALPLEDDYREIRRQVWLATDTAYKEALEDFSRKRAVLQTQTRSEDIPDFTREEALTITDVMPPAAVKQSEAEAMVRTLSAIFTEMADVYSSSTHIEVINNSIRYVNSEGTSFTRLEPGVMFTAIAKTQAGDGMPLEDFVGAYGRSMQDLSQQDLAARIREMGVRLKELRQAPLIERYSGPVLIEGQAAAELFSGVFAPKLLAVRRPISENPQLGMFFAQPTETFLDRIGTRVLPNFLNVADNPLLDDYDQVRLVGGYKVDEEGVRARETQLIEKGILKTLLASRDPVPGIMHSTGNNPGGTGPTPSNLIVTAGKGLSADEIKADLLRLVKERGKEYGVIVKRIPNPWLVPSVSQIMSMFMPGGAGGERGESIIAAFKVFPDGHEELIRNAELSGVTAATFKDILAASKEQTVYSAPFAGANNFSGMFSGRGGAGIQILSFVVPSFLFEDLTLKKTTGEIPHPPVAKHPYFDK